MPIKKYMYAYMYTCVKALEKGMNLSFAGPPSVHFTGQYLVQEVVGAADSKITGLSCLLPAPVSGSAPGQPRPGSFWITGSISQ